jgi:hypothetical protein
MSLLLHRLINDYLPIKRKQTQKGWITFNAPCCHHRGHNLDTRGRGNFLAVGDGTLLVNCYNCGFKARYSGGDISHGFEAWMGYLGIPREKIQEAKLEILSKKLSGEIQQSEHNGISPIYENYKEVPLPDGSASFASYLEKEDQHPWFVNCLEYLSSRGRAVATGWDYFWSPSRKNDLYKRIIIPFYHRGRIIGWTGRYCGTPPKNVPRYLNSDLPGGYLFNSDVLLSKDRKYAIIVEGPFDAISIDGISPLGSTMNKHQVSLLNSVDVEKIVLPDRESKNQELIDVALANDWSVSFPYWEEKIKDAADASKKYGKLYTISSIIGARTKSKLDIGMKRQMLKG